MILSVAMHKPKGLQEEETFLAALKEYGEMQRGCKGHHSYSVGKDDQTGFLIVVSMWDSMEDMKAASDKMIKFRKTFDFKTNQVGPTRYYQGNADFIEFPLNP